MTRSSSSTSLRRSSASGSPQYHCRPHADLVDPGLPKIRMSPAAMFEHGLARAGYIEVPRDPYLAYEFLATRWRTIQHYGVEIDSRRYSGRILKEYGDKDQPVRRTAQEPVAVPGRSRRRDQDLLPRS